MAYKNIVWVKLERRLLNDHRWYMMSDHAQLLYIKLILLAAETYNKIPKSEVVLIQALRSELEIGKFKGAIQEIQNNFPMFKSNKHFYYFGEFENKTNWLPNKQSPSNRPAIAQHSVEKNRIDKEKKREEEANPAQDIYLYYSKTIKPGAKEDAIKSISKLLKSVSKEDLIGRIDRYKAQLVKNPTEPQFYIQANNFFGEKARYKDFAPQESKLKAVDPNCPTCKGTGFVYNQSISKNEFCRCRIKEGE